MKTTLLILLAVMLGGCAKSEGERFKEQYMHGCQSTGGSEDQCECILDKLEDRYTEEGLGRMQRGDIPADFSDFNIKSALECRGE